MNKLIFANLLHRPVRSLISVLAVAIEVVMILSIVAIFMGMLNDQKQRTNGIGADLVVSPPNASFMNGVSGAPMSAKLAEVFRRLPHVTVAAPVISDFSMSGSVEILYGIDYASYDALKPFVFISGTPFQNPYDVIVDDVFAHAAPGREVGDSIKILNHDFRICGIVESGKGGRKLIPIETMGSLIGAEGKASVIYLKADNPGNDSVIINEIHSTHGLENYKVQTMADLIALYTPSKFPGFRPGAERGDHDCRDRGFPGHLPIDVHGGAGAHPGDRHSQIDGGIKGNDRGSDPARNGGAGGGGCTGRDCVHVRGEDAAAPQIPDVCL